MEQERNTLCCLRCSHLSLYESNCMSRALSQILLLIHGPKTVFYRDSPLTPTHCCGCMATPDASRCRPRNSITKYLIQSPFEGSCGSSFQSTFVTADGEFLFVLRWIRARAGYKSRPPALSRLVRSVQLRRYFFDGRALNACDCVLLDTLSRRLGIA